MRTWPRWRRASRSSTFFDGFRTSHEINKAKAISDETILALLEENYIAGHRERALSSDRPILRGTAQNPDVFFQAREACNSYYLACPTIVQDVMDRFAAQTGRSYHLFDYVGAKDATRVVILMGSASGAVEETIDALNKQGEKVGLLKVHLYRPFSADAFLAALPKTVRSIAVLDRTKEPGALGEPLYQDVVTSFSEAFAGGKSGFAQQPRVIGGRYGLSSKEFTPAMAKGVFDELKKPQMKNHFTIGIQDDVTHTSLAYDPEFSTEDPRTVRALLLRARFGWYGGSEQEFHQDHRPGDAELRAGIFCLRLEKVRLSDDIAPAFRAGSNPLDLPDQQGKFCGLPPVHLPGADGRAGSSRARVRCFC